jgi:hypothetical protein
MLISTASDITVFIASQPAMVEIFRAVEALSLLGYEEMLKTWTGIIH